MPHKVLAPDQFVADVGKLRERFVDHNHEHFILKKQYDKAIPADGFGDYAYNVSHMEDLGILLLTAKDMGGCQK